MVLQSDEVSVRFRSPADKLYALQKIKAEIADKAQNQFEVFLEDSVLPHEEEFKSFHFRKDRLDSFLATYFASQNCYGEVWHVCKLIFVLSHGQSSIKRGFPVTKEVLQDNLQEKSLVSQRLIYDSLCSSSNLNIEEFEITKSLRFHGKFSSQRYKQELEKNKQKSALKRSSRGRAFEGTTALSIKDNICFENCTRVRVIESR